MNKMLKIVMLMVVVSFTGQSLSNANICHHMMSHPNNSLDHSVTDHASEHTLMSHSNHGYHMDHDQRTADCCIADCVCSTSVCSSISFINTNLLLTSVQTQQSCLHIPPQKDPTPVNSHLFRPPIFS